jgi:hypothetical protein
MPPGAGEIFIQLGDCRSDDVVDALLSLGTGAGKTANDAGGIGTGGNFDHSA